MALATILPWFMFCFLRLARGDGWTQVSRTNCYDGHGATSIDHVPVGTLSLAACEAKCNELADCSGIVFAIGGVTGACWRRKDINLAKCVKGAGYDTWIKGSGPSPTPPPPTPPASFIVIGDWGYNSGCHSNVKRACQGLIAEAMKDFMQQQGSQLKFIVNVGDSFYCDGVSSSGDDRWQSFWRSYYFDGNAARDLTSLPWYSVYGNHDMGNRDPCPCTTADQCHQVNSGIHNWIMPDLTYHVARDDLNIEIVAMDFNIDWTGQICKYVACKSTCASTLAKRARDSVQYFLSRYELSTARTLIAFSHYPTDYIAGPQNDLFNKLKDNSKHDVVYFGGHRHNVDQMADSIAPNVQWLVGGGGGYSCDGSQQGFVKGFIHSDGTVTTEAALVSASACCGSDKYRDGAPAPGAGSIESISCFGGNCTSLVFLQGVCIPGRKINRLIRVWCEAGGHVKIDEMDDSCSKQLAWHLVSQDIPVPPWHADANSMETVEYRCNRSTTIPIGWTAPENVVVPHPSYALQSVRWGEDQNSITI